MNRFRVKELPMYFLSINKARPDAKPAEFGRVIGDHVRWLKTLIDQGKVRQGGKWGDTGGMMIIEAQDRSEAEAIQRQDPLVAAGLVDYELSRFEPDVEIGTSAAETKHLVIRYIEEVWNQGNITALRELTLPTFRYFLGGEPPRDRDAFGEFIAGARVSFPDWRVEIDQVIAQSGAVAARWHGRVTHRGPLRGIAPTGRSVSVSGINIYEIESGKIATEWEQTDTFGLLRQLGVLPA